MHRCFLQSLNVTTAAARSVRDSAKFQKVLEVVLAFGNYMNSAKRGGVFGFKMSSLDSVGFLVYSEAWHVGH